jgi:hypothetical protein
VCGLARATHEYGGTSEVQRAAALRACMSGRGGVLLTTYGEACVALRAARVTRRGSHFWTCTISHGSLLEDVWMSGSLLGLLLGSLLEAVPCERRWTLRFAPL